MAHKRIYLIRHGQTAGNEKKRYVGNRTDEELSDLGVRETLSCRSYYGDLLRPEKGKLRYFSSPLKRALQTADLLFDHPRITALEDLREIDFGDFEGKDYLELSGKPLYREWIDSNGRLPVPGGEDRDAFVKRSVRGFREALGDPDTDETVVIICHGGTVMALMSDLTGLDYYDFYIGNLMGYRLDLEMNHEGISDLSYDRIGLRDPA